MSTSDMNTSKHVTISCYANARYKGVVYASVSAGDETLINTTLDNCLSACNQRGWAIDNAQDVLFWLHQYVTFEAY